MTFYNEHDKFAVQWLRNLSEAGHISKGVVDERDIQTILPAELAGMRRVHFFAGIGGWDYALRLAGWPAGREVWTGSCPCQPFSCAGKGKGEADERHLWPDMFRLVRECRPATVFGEQVASAIGHGWLDGVFADLEGQGYSCGAVVLPACSVGAPHKRDRIFWCAALPMANLEGTTRQRPERRSDEGVGAGGCGQTMPVEHGEIDGRIERMAAAEQQRGPAKSGGTVPVAQDSVSAGRGGRGDGSAGGNDGEVKAAGLRGADGVGQLQNDGQPREQGTWGGGTGITHSSGIDRPWSRYSVVLCADGKARRIAPEPEIFPLAHGLPGRVGKLRGAGNAIVPQVAAEFIKAFMDV